VVVLSHAVTYKLHIHSGTIRDQNLRYP